MTEKRQKKADFKKHRAGHTEGDFSLPCKIPTLALMGQAPNPKKQKQRQMVLASLVSSQKQKRTIVKIFSKSDTKKRFFRGGNNRTFIVSLVDTR